MTEPLPTDRQTEIRLAATGLFAQLGYRGVGMRAIADAVGMRTSSLYHHFPSKEHILHAITLGVTRDFIEGHVGLLDGEEPAAERLGRLVRAHIVYLAAHRFEQAVARRESVELGEEWRAEVWQYERMYINRIEAFIADGVADGELVASDARLAALGLVDMLNGVNLWFREGGPYAIEEIADHYVAMACRLLGAGAPDQAATGNGYVARIP